MDVASVFSLDDGDSSFSETSANARIAPQKTVIVVSREFLKCSFCIKNVRIIKVVIMGKVRAQIVICFCCMFAPALVLPPGREAAKFKLRVAHGATAYFSPTGISAAKCDVLQLLQHRQQVNTSARSDHSHWRLSQARSIRCAKFHMRFKYHLTSESSSSFSLSFPT